MVRRCSTDVPRVCLFCDSPFLAPKGNVSAGYGKYCSWPCRVRRHEKTHEEKFWARVSRGEGCWFWRGPVKANGYGYLRVNSFNVYAHRFSYERSIGAIPMGLLVLHRCDVRSCVNPGHLFLGTARDNTRDMMAKGRAVFHGVRQEPNAR